MEILAIGKMQNHCFDKHFEKFIECLKHLENDVTRLDSLDSHQEIIYTEKEFDLIVALNTEGLDVAKKLNASISKVKAIMFVTLESCYLLDYNNDWETWRYLLIIKDTFDSVNGLFLPNISTFYRIPYELEPCSNKSEVIGKKILVMPEESVFASKILVELAPILNSLNHITFDICYQHNNVPDIYNSNVSVITDIQDFQQYRMVIGSGIVAEKAISNYLPTLIIGKKGFGGIIDSQNIKLQYESGFQGRLGGESGEYIPPSLVLAEINGFIEREEDDVAQLIKGNNKLYQLLCEGSLGFLNATINNVLQQGEKIRKSFENCELIVSNLFEIIPTGKDEYLLRKSKTKQSHSIISKSELAIIQQFYKGKKVKEIIPLVDSDIDENSLLEFISELLEEKVIIMK